MSELKEHNGDGIRYAMHLSAPKGGIGQMLRDPSGNWVSYDDYARLKAKVEWLEEFCTLTIIPNEILQSENERLRKAGDELLHEWSSGDEKEARNFMKALVIWNAAKQGKPSV